MRILQAQQEDKQWEEDGLKQQARIDKKIPVIVTLNADRLNSAEVGAGFGTDTGVRLRGQYRRAIVNKRGHSSMPTWSRKFVKPLMDAITFLITIH